MSKIYIIFSIINFINIITVNTQNFRLQNNLELNNNKNWSTINYIERSKNIFPSWNNECSRCSVNFNIFLLFFYFYILIHIVFNLCVVKIIE